MHIIVTGTLGADLTEASRILQLLGVRHFEVDAELDPADRGSGSCWERVDVTQLNRWLIRQSGCERKDLHAFDLSEAERFSLKEFHHRGEEIVTKLNPSVSWSLVDPWFCLTLPMWRPLLKSAMVVFIHGPAGRGALRLQKDFGIPFSGGVAAWEFFARHGLNACVHLPAVYLPETDFSENPTQCAQCLRDALERSGACGLVQEADLKGVSEAGVPSEELLPEPYFSPDALAQSVTRIEEFLSELRGYSENHAALPEPGEELVRELATGEILRKMGMLGGVRVSEPPAAAEKDGQISEARYRAKIHGLEEELKTAACAQALVDDVYLETRRLVMAPRCSLARMRAAWRLLRRGSLKSSARVLENMDKKPTV